MLKKAQKRPETQKVHLAKVTFVEFVVMLKKEIEMLDRKLNG